MKKYLIVEFPDTDDVAKAVNHLIADGWEPQGGLTTIHEFHERTAPTGRHYYVSTICYAQAMIDRGT